MQQDTKEKTSIYRRGSRFCSDMCVQAWEAANPPPVAKGDPDKLREELVILLDEVVAEAHRRFGPGVDLPIGPKTKLWTSLWATPGSTQNRTRDEAIATSKQLLQTHALRAAPILRTLGFTHEATVIDSTDFQAHATGDLIAALVVVRKQL